MKGLDTERKRILTHQSSLLEGTILKAVQTLFSGKHPPQCLSLTSSRSVREVIQEVKMVQVRNLKVSN